MKKRAGFLAMVMAAALLLSACGGGNTASGGGDSAGGGGAAASGEGFSGTLKLSHGLTEEHPVQKAMLQMASEVEEKTGGAIKIQVYANATLGSEKDNIEQMQIGALDMAKVSASALEAFAPVYQAFSVPYIFNSQEHFYSVMDGEIAEDVFQSTADKGFVGLSWLDSGARSFYTRDTAINTPADLKGLKIRTMDSPMAFEMMNAFGGSATTMSISDVFTAMQSGVIDGAENNETALTTGGHGEVAKFYSADEHTRIPDIILIATKVWNQMTPEQQEIVKTAANNAKETYKTDWNAAIADAIEKSQSEQGVTFNYPDKAPFQEAVKPIYERLAAEEPEVWALCERIQNAG